MKLTDKHKFLVEGVITKMIKGTPSIEVVADIVVAPDKKDAIRQAFEVRIQENDTYVAQGALQLLAMIRTLRYIYNEPVQTTQNNFLKRLQN